MYFVGLTDSVKRGVLTLIDEILRYRNYRCYYETLSRVVVRLLQDSAY